MSAYPDGHEKAGQPEPPARTLARILAGGFNRFTREHGPDADYTGEVMETMAGGAAFIVQSDGKPYVVTVSEQRPDGPLMQGDWR